MRIADMTIDEIIDRVYDAWTLEDAIYWREQFVARLAHMIVNVDILDRSIADVLGQARSSPLGA